ncbi:TadE-like protein [Rhodovulum bhavnagarense]|uniref:TadE-like protein n=1 Tax=Rhodovulum bhavnagarense TaxID=992286 RepID=A0A4R2RFP9_9RHOB|nr:TadE family protein [Rhodovulum bhavnagarense]TCP60907.1 TadE-like protein [Rhodovulum bhavnagarense]
MRQGHARGSPALAPERFKSESHASVTVEFALIAPLLVIMVLGTAEIGVAVQQRLALDHILRAGAFAAQTDPGEKAVEDAMQAVRADLTDPAFGKPAFRNHGLDVTRFCVCPENPDVAPGVAPPCGTVCSGGRAPHAVYLLQGTLTYETRLLGNAYSTPLTSTLWVGLP